MGRFHQLLQHMGVAASTPLTILRLRLLLELFGGCGLGLPFLVFGDQRSKMQSYTDAARTTGNDGSGLSTASVERFLLCILPSLVFIAWWQCLSWLPTSAVSLQMGVVGQFSFGFQYWPCRKVLQNSCEQAGKHCKLQNVRK